MGPPGAWHSDPPPGAQKEGATAWASVWELLVASPSCTSLGSPVPAFTPGQPLKMYVCVWGGGSGQTECLHAQKGPGVENSLFQGPRKEGQLRNLGPLSQAAGTWRPLFPGHTVGPGGAGPAEVSPCQGTRGQGSWQQAEFQVPSGGSPALYPEDAWEQAPAAHRARSIWERAPRPPASGFHSRACPAPLRPASLPSCPRPPRARGPRPWGPPFMFAVSCSASASLSACA